MRIPTIFLLLVLIVPGCTRRSSDQTAAPPSAPAVTETSTGNASEPGTAPPEQASPPIPPVATTAPSALSQPIQGVVDPFLTSQLRIFIQEKGRMPETFSEFAGARLDSVPRLAKGLGYAIDPTTQEVKIVAK